MKKQYWIIFLLAVIITASLGMLIYFTGQDKDRTFINRAVAAKMAVLALNGYDSVSIAREMDEGEPWYDYYIEEAKLHCGMNKDQDPMDLLTYGEAVEIAAAFGVDASGLLPVEHDEMENPISSHDWYELYDKIIAVSENVELLELFVLASPSNNEELSPWQCLTDHGVFGAEGLSVDRYMNRGISVYVCGSEIAAIRDFVTGEKTLHNLWAVSGHGKSLTVYTDGYYVDFDLAAPLESDIKNIAADIIFDNGDITSVTLKSTVIKGEIIAVGDDYIDIKNYGRVSTTENFCVYSMDDGICEVSRSQLEPGNKHTEFIVEGDQICAAVIWAQDQAKTIRAVISCDGYIGYVHSVVSLTSSVAFWTVCNDVRTDYSAGEILNVDENVLAQGETMTVQTSASAGMVQLLSLNRTCGHPQYRGSIEITNSGQGFIIINELLLEDYLYGVVPSEMPPSYDLEALKVQAVCARSFAADAIENPHFPEYNANVDDSTSTQVYNNSGEDEKSNQAVDDTRGQVLQWGDTFVKAYFYSTSCGSSSSPSEVWLSGDDPVYMKGGLQAAGQSERDFSCEDDFRLFIDDYQSIDYFEKDVSWFRWKTTMNLSDIKTAVDKNLLTRIRIVPSLITVMDESGEFVEKEISTIGDVLRVSTEERSQSGILKSVIIEGTEAVVRICGEYNIRLLLAPLNSDIICDDQTNAGTMTMLPSGYFYIDDLGDGNYLFRGGGYGHGVGMSQNGVQQLAHRGFDFEAILEHYFPGTQIVQLK